MKDCLRLQWFTVTIDTVMNTLVMMGASPELGTPADQTHIVHSTAVLNNVSFGSTDERNPHEHHHELLVSFDAFDRTSLTRIRLRSDRLTDVHVYLDGTALKRVESSLLSMDDISSGMGEWSLNSATGVLEVKRTVGGQVKVVCGLRDPTRHA